MFVVGAYLPNGGAYMAYRLARILELDFGWKGVAVSIPGQGPPSTIHEYDIAFPSISLKVMEQSITAHDILIANPSFSTYQFGLRLPGRKLMYVQGFSTYGVLDCYFDHYVAASGFVASFVTDLYGIELPVVPPFMRLEDFPPPTQWLQRPAASILVSAKGNDAILARLRGRIAREAPDIKLDDVLSPLPDAVPHRELIERLGSYRYLVSLSPAEGFGLIPLEAMGMGTVVLGFDGFGGREYMRSGQNCLVTSYPGLDELTRQVIAAVRDPALAQRLSDQGKITAQAYTYSRFHSAWHEQLSRFLQAGSVA